MKMTKYAVFICAAALSAALFSGCRNTAVETPKPSIQDEYRVYYEIFVGGFYDSNGDGVGDIAGITEKLDYLNDGNHESASSLGVGGLWLMPVMPGASYHKYDVTDYYNIDPSYGTLEDFEALAAECRKRGVSLILDLPLNHTSDAHPWFTEAVAALAGGYESPYTGWYQFSDEAKPGFHQVPGAPGKYYGGAFWSGMPELDLDNPDVRREILEICKFWMEKGASGFRLDAVTYYYEGNTGKNTEFLKWLNDELTAMYPDIYIVGEAWSDGGTILSLYESGISGFFNFPFAQSTGTIIWNIRSGDGEALAKAVEKWNASIKQANPRAIDAPFLTNHDMARSAGALMNNTVLQKQAAAVYLLLPGNPFIYYGEEIGMRGGSESDENKRMPFVWSLKDVSGIPNPPPGATNDTLPTAGLAEQLEDSASLARFYIDALRVRNSHPEIAHGTLTALLTGQKSVCAYTFDWQDKTTAVYHNLGSEEVTVAVEGKLTASLAAGGEGPTVSGGKLTLPGYSTAIITVK